MPPVNQTTASDPIPPNSTSLGKEELSDNNADVLEGKRILLPTSFGFRFIGLIAFLWSVFQMYVVVVPVNDVFVL